MAGVEMAGMRVNGAVTEGHMMYVVSKLAPAENGAIARAVMPVIAQREKRQGVRILRI